MKKTGSKGYVSDFSVDYDAIAVDDFRHSQLYNEKEWHSIIKCSGLLKSAF